MTAGRNALPSAKMRLACQLILEASVYLFYSPSKVGLPDRRSMLRPKDKSRSRSPCGPRDHGLELVPGSLGGGWTIEGSSGYDGAATIPAEPQRERLLEMLAQTTGPLLRVSRGWCLEANAESTGRKRLRALCPKPFDI